MNIKETNDFSDETRRKRLGLEFLLKRDSKEIQEMIESILFFLFKLIIFLF